MGGLENCTIICSQRLGYRAGKLEAGVKSGIVQWSWSLVSE